MSVLFEFWLLRSFLVFVRRVGIVVERLPSNADRVRVTLAVRSGEAASGLFSDLLHIFCHDLLRGVRVLTCCVEFVFMSIGPKSRGGLLCNWSATGASTEGKGSRAHPLSCTTWCSLDVIAVTQGQCKVIDHCLFNSAWCHFFISL